MTRFRRRLSLIPFACIAVLGLVWLATALIRGWLQYEPLPFVLEWLAFGAPIYVMTLVAVVLLALPFVRRVERWLKTRPPLR